MSDEFRIAISLLLGFPLFWDHSMGNIDLLVAQAEQATRDGNRIRAVEFWRQVLAIDPEYPAALNALGNWELLNGEFDEAVRLFDRANCADPRQPAVLFNLAAAQRASGQTLQAITSLKQALEADPDFVQAMFQMGILYEEIGDAKSAAEVYRNFLSAAPEEILGDSRFASPLAHARNAVAVDDQALDTLIGLSKDTSMWSTRITEAIYALVGKDKIFNSEPTFFHIPRLPSIPFLDRNQTPWISELESWTMQITAEVELLLSTQESGAFAPYIEHPVGMPLNQWGELDRSHRWSAFHLWKHGNLDERNARQLPVTMKALAGIPKLEIDGRGPNAFISLLAPKTRIPPHTGVTNARMTVHLPIVVPANCGFRVGVETREWKCGEAWVFDDSIEHEAW
ncbi:MAG: aspartyl/asparaginyl beta-hydroxylase domain-containing protein, partial [Sphingorhabdus sp.]|uniref:aspartyl/asparaginyl beta-hydroxylase domain-containing protein n=1 Tax=Sphingorhabdus sp. TaxID=1902408 RepID=UPI003CA40A71